MTDQGMPFRPEDEPLGYENLADGIREQVMALSFSQDPWPLKRVPVTEPIELVGRISQDAKWDVIEADIANSIEALGDESLAGIVTRPLEPERVFWRLPSGKPVETMLIRFNDEFSLAYDVAQDDNMNPVAAITTLWHADEEAVADFLKKHSIHSTYGEEQAEEEEAEDYDELPEVLPEGSNRRQNILLLALQAVRQLEMIYYLPDVPYSGHTGPAPYVEGVKKKDVARPAPKLGGVRNGHVPPAVNMRNHPMRIPKPHSGNKRGKRLSF